MMHHAQSLDRRLRMSTTKQPLSHNRSGTALIVAVICLTLLSAITISLVRLSRISQHQAERDQWRLQSAWLAESAINRAASQLDTGNDIEREDWTPTEIGPSAQTGRVAITVTSAPDDETRLTITATADFPDHPTDRVRTTRVRTITRTQDGNTAPAAEETP